MFQNLLYLLITFGLLTNLNNAESFSECEDVEDETFIAVASDCSKAIYCNGENSEIVECSSAEPYFSEEEYRCSRESNVCGKRPFGSNVATTTTTKKPVVTPPTNSESTTKINSNVAQDASTSTTPTTTVTSTTTTTPTTTDPSTTVPSTTTTTRDTPISSSSLAPLPSFTTSNPSTTNLRCPSPNDNTKPLFLPFPQSCTQYYLCSYGMATVLQCPNGLYFDVNLQSCNTAQQVQCQWNNNELSPREQCQPHIVDVYPHPGNCNYYYLCDHGYLMVMQCAFNMAWDYQERKCFRKEEAKCYKNSQVH